MEEAEMDALIEELIEEVCTGICIRFDTIYMGYDSEAHFEFEDYEQLKEDIKALLRKSYEKQV